MNAATAVSHVASPMECDTRQTPARGATSDATADATAGRKPASLRDLARDILARQRCDKAESDTATELRNSIDRCCDARGDDASNRAGLIAECGRLTPPEQVEMRAHFDAEAVRWQRANRGEAPLTPIRGSS